MYHTESYIDKEGVDSSSHMISLAGKTQGRDVLVWAVWTESGKARQYRERLRQWFVEALGETGWENETRINRELLRVSSGLQCRLYLYYDNCMYRAGEGAKEGECCIGPYLGACVHQEGESQASLLPKEWKNMESRDPAPLGNIWQQNIMDCVMEDSLNYAYFMLWEVR
ncbi:MAG: hypothetical protein LUH19_00930 [Lachnospiraceae bacterium]|nr:hypothetical protein [Lachnospiraceae bacterium]